jgi:hypothetical protein
MQAHGLMLVPAPPRDGLPVAAPCAEGPPAKKCKVAAEDAGVGASEGVGDGVEDEEILLEDIRQIKSENPLYGVKRVHRAVSLMRAGRERLLASRVKNLMKALGLVNRVCSANADISRGTCKDSNGAVVENASHTRLGEALEEDEDDEEDEEGEQELYSEEDEKGRLEGLDHGGRARTFAHVEGNWATHVYLPVRVDSGALSLARDAVLAQHPQLEWQWFDDESHQTLASASPAGNLAPPTTPTLASAMLCSKAKGELASMRLHMSVSRTVCLRKHQICSFMDHLRTALRREYRGTTPLHAVRGRFQALTYYRNDERTRHFCAWSLCAEAAEEARNVITRVDSVLAAFGLPPYRDDRPEPHVSFGWALPAGDRCEDVDDRLKASNDSVFTPVDGLAPGAVTFDRVLCSVGNQAFEFPLSPVLIRDHSREPQDS